MKASSVTYVLKAYPRPLLSYTSNARKRTVQDILLQLLGYQKLVSKLHEESDVNLLEKSEVVGQAQEKLLQRVKGSEESEIFKGRTCADVSILWFKCVNIWRTR